MKTVLLVCTLILHYHYHACSATITAVQNGNWSSNSTWDLNRVPANNDVVIIPSARTVFLRNTPYPKNELAQRPSLDIRILGTFDFSDAGTDKLYLAAGSKIQVYLNGRITTSNNSNEIIAIHNGSSDNNVWDGSPSTLNGPLHATSTSVGFLNGVLPLRFVSFNLSSSEEKLNVAWTTADERNTSHFDIEIRRSDEAKWIVAATIPAAGYSTRLLDYNYVIKRLYRGTYYVRIRQVDIDGQYSYSIVRTATFVAEKTASLVYDAINSRIFAQLATGTELTVIDSRGQIRLCQRIEHEDHKVSLNGLEPGLYVASLTLSNKPVCSLKVVIY